MVRRWMNGNVWPMYLFPGKTDTITKLGTYVERIRYTDWYYLRVCACPIETHTKPGLETSIG